jgi:hypothetical protein
MSSRFLAVCLLLALGFVPMGQPAQAQSPGGKLIPTPNSGRPNDPFFISGGGFQPNKDISISIFCPDWVQTYNGRYSYPTPVRTDGRGSFLAVKLYVFRPLAKKTPCTLYASDGANPLGAGVRFNIIPSTDSPVRAFPIRLRMARYLDHSRATVSTDVQGAPGALLTFVTTYGGGKETYKKRLPWTGHSKLHLPVPPGTPANGLVQVSAHGRLGALKGSAKTRFMARRLVVHTQ